ncbi:MAG: hypothetical protein Q8N51_06160 [Gammaproteobacteria bacterium]|jgi:hypothetical protein|nr:hypothetical protein [Gammaproteobacteria bacterium]
MLDRRRALLLVRVHEGLPLRCPQCGEPTRVITSVLERPVIERILDYIGVIGGRLGVIPSQKNGDGPQPRRCGGCERARTDGREGRHPRRNLRLGGETQGVPGVFRRAEGEWWFDSPDVLHASVMPVLSPKEDMITPM